MKMGGARYVALGWAMALFAQTAAAAAKLDLDLPAGPLLTCLERVALAAHVRIVDRSGQAAQAPCVRLKGRFDFADAMNRLLPSTQWQWQRLDAGTVEISAAAPTRLDLDQLDVDGAPLPAPGVERPRGPAPTLLADQATATTRIDHQWLDTAPLVSFAQIGRYAPNVYGSGSGLSIRGVVRNNGYSTALSFDLDGMDLGALLLDNDLVPLEGVEQIDLVHGPRAFEAGVNAAAGGVRLYTTAPAAEAEGRVSVGAGSKQSWLVSTSWSGPILDDVGASVTLQRRVLPDDVTQVLAPSADIEHRRNDGGRVKISFQPQAVPGLSAQVSLLAANGDSSDRFVKLPLDKLQDVFKRKNYERDVFIGETHGRAASAQVRYELNAGSSVEAYASALAAQRHAAFLPRNDFFVEQGENNNHAGIVYSGHFADTWTLSAGADRSRNSTREVDDNHAISDSQGLYRDTHTNSLWAWLERKWNEQWSAGVGLRWVHERIASYYYRQPSTVPVSLHTQAEDTIPIPMATVSWTPAPTQSLVFAHSWGFRSGGSGAYRSAFDADRERDTELAWNATWLDQRLRTHAALFKEDFYAVARQAAAGQPYNQLRSRQQGIEGEMELALTEHLRARAGMGWLSSRDSKSSYLVDIAGHHLPGAPSHTATLGLRYGGETGLYAAADAYRSGVAHGDPYPAGRADAGAASRYPAFCVVDLRVGYRWRRWDGALTVSNALNENYLTHPTQTEIPYVTNRLYTFQLGDPRRIELRFSRSW